MPCVRMVVSKAITGRPEAIADTTSGLTVRELGGTVDPTEYYITCISHVVLHLNTISSQTSTACRPEGIPPPWNLQGAQLGPQING